MAKFNRTKVAQAAADVTDVKDKNEQQDTLFSFLEAMGVPRYTLEHPIVTFVARITLYALGTVAAVYLTAWVSTLLAAAGVWTFVATVIELMTLMLGLAAAWKGGDAIVDFVGNGGVGRAIDSAKSWFSSKLSTKSRTLNESLAAQPTVH